VEPIRILVADDHVLFRRGLHMVLAQEPDLDLIGEAADGAEAVALALELVPDVILMDVKMPRRNGIEACQMIKDAAPSIRILMLTNSDEDSDLYEAVKAGAAGYLLKEISIDELASAVRAVHGGQSLITPSMATKLMAEFAAMARRGSDSRLPRLTPRELDVLRGIARGMTNREIAKSLFISENTVRSHVQNILDKLQLKTRMEAAIYAMRVKLVDLD
jgi:two-component system NarL family response regulator